MSIHVIRYIHVQRACTYAGTARTSCSVGREKVVIRRQVGGQRVTCCSCPSNGERLNSDRYRVCNTDTFCYRHGNTALRFSSDKTFFTEANLQL